MILLSSLLDGPNISSFFFSFKEEIFWVHPIQRLCSEKEEFHLLIKDYPKRFIFIYLYFVYSIQCFVLRDELDPLVFLDFGVRSELSKHLSKGLLRM